MSLERETAGEQSKTTLWTTTGKYIARPPVGQVIKYYSAEPYVQASSRMSVPVPVRATWYLDGGHSLRGR